MVSSSASRSRPKRKSSEAEGGLRKQPIKKKQKALSNSRPLVKVHNPLSKAETQLKDLEGSEGHFRRAFAAHLELVCADLLD
jgi:hypothetical protein